MQCLWQTVCLALLFTICNGNGGNFRSDESFSRGHLSEDEACPILKKYVSFAKREVAEDEAFREYLISKNVIVESDEPAAFFLNSVPLPDNLIKIYHDSSVVFEVSKKYAELLFRNRLPHSRNINPLLRGNKSCLEDFFAKFCVDNKHYACDENQKYRSIDGYCTNLNSPKGGAAYTPFVSFVYQNYDDSISKFRRGAQTKNRLPLARELSNIILDRCQHNDSFLNDGPSVGGAQFGVFLAQDTVALAYPKSSPSLTCCKKDYSTILPSELLHKTCDPIKIPKDDKFFSPLGITCMNFLRTQNSYDNECVLSSRKQLNIVTSFVDLSQIYGNDKEIGDSVRSFVGGLLKTNAANLFPEDANGNFILSDFRTAGSPVIILYPVLFLREHNRIARVLKKKYPKWKDEKLFEEARRWNIAQYQYIVFDWINNFIPEEYKHLRITKKHNNKLTSASSNEFGHAILRQHHRFITQTVQLYDQYGNVVDEIYLSDANPFDLIRNSLSNLARSLFYQKPNFNGCHDQIRNQLLKNPAGVGLDLFSYDITRGRDHGIQPYFKYVELCLHKKIKSFSDLRFIISDEDINELRKVYDTVYDIDLYIGARLEKRPKKYHYGPVGSCIVNEQFHRYRHGDLLFYDSPEQNYPFTEAQLAEIRKSSFSRILCNNGDITKVSKNAFLIQSSSNPIVNCRLVPTMNIVY